jgi:hypothetical protein
MSTKEKIMVGVAGVTGVQELQNERSSCPWQKVAADVYALHSATPVTPATAV